MLSSLVIFTIISSFVYQTIALHCLVVRPGHGLISEKCPRLAVACRVRVEKNSIVWYENKLYDRNRLACVLQNEYGSGERSGCVRKPSGAVRCWCYGQSNCNNPENSRKLYKAFLKGDQKELERVIDEIETSDMSDYNFAEPSLNIYEPIDLGDSDEIQSSSHAHTSLSKYRARPATHVPADADGRSPERTTKRPKSFVMADQKSANKSLERLHKLSRHTAATMMPPRSASPASTKSPIHVASSPSRKPSVGLLYEGPDDPEILSERKQQNPKFYTEPVGVVRTLPTDHTSKGSKKIKPTVGQNSEEQKHYEAIELRTEGERGYPEKETVRKGASSRKDVTLFDSLVALAICIFVL